MNSSIGNKKKGRAIPGGRRPRGPERPYMVSSKPSRLNEGIYANARSTHWMVNLMGTTVTVQVKNGTVYEGIFDSLSADMEVVLKVVHVVDESTPEGDIPSKESLVDTIIFNFGDIVNIATKDFDSQYAVKQADGFTDAAISATKVNGQSAEKELQPWEGAESGESIEGGLEGTTGSTATAANGWDADAMFNTNAEKFNVKSDYDPKLSQYTTPIKKDDSVEFKRLEANAERLAHEIERSENYRQNVDLENVNGDEEMLYSAVHRDQAKDPTRYIPPHLRNKQAQGRRNGPPNTAAASPAAHNNSSPTPSDDSARHKDTEQKAPETREPTSPLAQKDAGKKPSTAAQNASKPREEQIRELKDFSNQFKLSDPESKEKRVSVTCAVSSVSQVVSASPAKLSTEAASSTAVTASSSTPAVSATAQAAADPAQKLDEAAATAAVPEKKEEEMAQKVKKSVLNPYAKEFNPTAKAFTPRPPMQVSTPPRPTTQSPVVNMPQGPPMQGQHMFHHPPYVVPVTLQGQATALMNANCPRFTTTTGKKVTVSVQPRPDLNQAAQAATGTPILAQNVMPHHPQAAAGQQYPMHPYLHQSMIPGMQQVYPQVMPAAAARLVTPPMMPATQQMSADGSIHPAQQQQMPPTAPVFVPQHAGNMHMGPPQQQQQQQQQQGQQPGHIAPHHQQTPPLSQSQSQLPPPPPHSSATGPPNASPAPGQQPNSGGTPQPHHLVYGGQQQQQQQQPPPLQPSPHTPTSPQYPPPVSLGPYTYTACVSMPGGAHCNLPGSIQHMAFGQTHTQVTHAQHQHSHVMMHAQGQQQPGQGHPAGPPNPMQYHPMSHHPMHHAPPQMPGQAGPAMMHQAINVSNPGHHQVYMHTPNEYMSYSHRHPALALSASVAPQGPPPNAMQAGASYGHNQ